MCSYTAQLQQEFLAMHNIFKLLKPKKCFIHGANATHPSFWRGGGDFWLFVSFLKFFYFLFIFAVYLKKSFLKASEIIW